MHFDVSFDEGRGDLTTSAALQVAKKVGKSPRDVAAALAEGFGKIPGVTATEVAGAGFVNVSVATAELIKGFSAVRTACLPSKKRKEAPVIVDYSSPNIAKPLGIHHILSTVIGQTMVNLYDHAGYEMVRWNYLGDWGTQFGKLAVAVKKWGKKPVNECSLDELLALYVRFHQEAEKDSTLEEEGQEAFRKLEAGDKELKSLWKDAVVVTKKTMDSIYKRLHVSFDIDRGESYYEGKMSSIVEEGKKKGVFKNGEKGALIVEFSEESKLPPAVVMKGDGATLYLTRDLALMKDRFEGWHPKAILWAVDVAQQLYFRQLFATVDQLGWKPPHLEHISFGRMRFSDRSMSTRKGNILKLEDALDEAVSRAEKLIEERGEKIQTDDPKGLAEMMGVGALVYGILSQNRKMDMVFDWDKMLTFEGNSAPYLQYTHARARSVLRKAGTEGSVSDIQDVTDKERTLMKLILMFGETVEDARAEHLPHKLTNYLYELCQAFNSFYNSDEILTAPQERRDFRLAITLLTADVLRTGAELLTLRVPERM